MCATTTVGAIMLTTRRRPDLHRPSCAAVLIVALSCAIAAQAPAGKPANKAVRPAQPAQSAPYFPERFEWTRKAPAEVGMDAARLDDAVKFAVANENPSTRDLALDLALTYGAREPFDTLIGPAKERGPASGMIVRRGYVVAEWGDTTRVDMTFSVTKSFLSTVVGLAWQKGLVRDLNDLARDYMPAPGYFEGHNATISWDHLLRQTSDWQGTLWGKPDWADRPEGEKPSDWPNRKLYEPGTHYKYNDTRVNLLALLALNVWRRPLPSVLREEVMDPIGASSTWRWHGYDNSWVELDGQRIQSVSGGGHFGGGMFISAGDMARFGYLFLRNGRWKDRQIVSEQWIRMARTPGPANEGYGFMNWFLNTKRAAWPSAPESAVCFVGNGQNIIYMDWEHDLVAVVRWIRGGNALDTLLGKVIGAVNP
jgi:CubicO group peptidase (beta-lactamase class C family)